MTLLTEDTVTIVCRAGHNWTIARPRRGKWPEYCPEHKRFFLEQLSNRVKPPVHVRQEWLEQGKMLDDEGYAAKWDKFWTRAVRMVGAVGGSWNAVDVDAVDRYVRAVRMAELHRLYAQDQPYSTTAHGSVKPHPGFELAETEEKKAHKLAVALKLATPEESETQSDVQPKPPPRNASDTWNTRLQEEAEELGEVIDATGPDGDTL